MQEVEIYSQLSKVFDDIFDDASIMLTPQTSASDIDGWDSFNHINLILAIEASFEVRFSSSELEKMETVGDIVALIQGKLATKILKI